MERLIEQILETRAASLAYAASLSETNDNK